MPGDIHWGWLTVGMHLSGAGGSTSFPDVKGHSFTPNGSVACSSGYSRFGSEGSAHFAGGANDVLVCGASQDFNMVGGSLSVCWSMYSSAYPAAGKQCRLIQIGSNGLGSAFSIAINEYGQLGCYVPLGGKNYLFSASAVGLNAWHDLEVSAFNGNAFIFRDGALIAAKSGLDMPGDAGGNPNAMRIGGDNAGVAEVDVRYIGYLSELRFMARAGRHGGTLIDGSYTPETGPFPEGLYLPTMRPGSMSTRLRSSVPQTQKCIARAESGRLLDTEHGGHGRVVGTTQNTGTPNYPVSRRVRLFRKRDGVLARETWSDAAGNYRFERVRHDIQYVVTSYDHTGLYNAVIADAITPELMP